MSKCGLVNAILVLTIAIIAPIPTTFASAETVRSVYQNTTLAQLKPSGADLLWSVALEEYGPNCSPCPMCQE